MSKRSFRPEDAPEAPAYPTRKQARTLGLVVIGSAALATAACWPVATSGDIALPYEEPDAAVEELPDAGPDAGPVQATGGAIAYVPDDGGPAAEPVDGGTNPQQ
jgi:hypothetical protein